MGRKFLIEEVEETASDGGCCSGLIGLILILAVIGNCFGDKDDKKTSKENTEYKTEKPVPKRGDNKSTTSSFRQTKSYNQEKEELETPVKKENVEETETPTNESTEPSFHFEPIEKENTETNNEVTVE